MQNQLMSTEVTGSGQFSPPRLRSAVSYRYPVVSPDGKRVAYKSGSDLVVQQIDDGKVAKRFTLPQGNGLLGGMVARWPDCSVLAGGTPRTAMPCIMLDVEAGLARRLASRWLTMPAWSPDGTKITFDLRLSTGTEIWMHRLGSHQEAPHVPNGGSRGPGRGRGIAPPHGTKRMGVRYCKQSRSAKHLDPDQGTDRPANRKDRCLSQTNGQQRRRQDRCRGGQQEPTGQGPLGAVVLTRGKRAALSGRDRRDETRYGGLLPQGGRRRSRAATQSRPAHPDQTPAGTTSNDAIAERITRLDTFLKRLDSNGNGKIDAEEAKDPQAKLYMERLFSKLGREPHYPVTIADIKRDAEEYYRKRAASDSVEQLNLAPAAQPPAPVARGK